MFLNFYSLYSISDLKPTDKKAYLEHMLEKQIHDQTTNIPFPYTENDAECWISHVQKQTVEQGKSVNWAIRNRSDYLIGGIGFHNFKLGSSHNAEVGYWLAKPYWGQGIMTEALKSVSQYAFSEFGLIRITAFVFESNMASAKVLEKSGFNFEGTLRKYYRKNNNYLDAKIFAKIRE